MIPLVEIVKPYIIHYGYWAVFFGVFFESLGMPLPGETLIIVAGLVAAKGVLNFTWIIVIAVLATFIANNISYMGGYFGGRRFVIKYGKYVFLNEKRFMALENFVKRHGSKVVIAARFIIGMRQFNGFVAGTVKMPFGKFAAFNMIGAILWVVWWTGISYYFGKSFTGAFMKYYFLFGIITLVAIIITACHFLRNTSNDLSPKSQPA